MSLKAYAAEGIVYGPFPCCVGVSVEYDSSLGFARALFNSRNIVSGFLREKLIDGLDIKSELKNCQKQTCNDKNNRNDWSEEI